MLLLFSFSEAIAWLNQLILFYEKFFNSPLSPFILGHPVVEPRIWSLM